MKIVEYEFEGLRIRPAERELWNGDELLAVPRLVFDCIVYLIEHRERAVGRDELVAAVWGRSEVSEGHLNQIILRARRVIGDGGHAQQMIRTVPGFGYRWVAPVTTDIDTSAPVIGAAVTAAPTETPDTTPSARDTFDNVATAPTDPIRDAAAGTDLDGDVETLARSASNTAPGRRRTSWLVAGVVGLVIAVLGVTLHVAQRPPAPRSGVPSPAGDTVVVLPLDVRGSRETGWVGLGAMDLIAERLRGGDLVVSPSETVMTVLQGSERPFTPDDLARIRRTLGAGIVVLGRAIEIDQGWSVELTAQGSDGVRHQTEAQRGDAIQAARAAADLLLAALGHEPPRGDDGIASVQERLQQAQAALLTSQLDLARSILVGIPDDDASSAAEVRYRLAEVDFRAGRLDQADAALAALMQDPQIQDNPLRRARVLTLRGNIHYRRSAFADAAVDFDAAIAELATLSAPLDLCDALTRRGTARTALGDLAGATTDLGQARLLAEKAGDRLRVAHVDAGFGMLQLKQDRLELALPHMQAAIDQYEVFGAVERVVTLLNALVDAYSSLLRWREATALGERQWALRDRVADPGLMVITANRRGRGLIALGQFEAAEALLADIRTDYDDQRPGVLRYVHDLEAELAVQREQWPRALAAAEHALDMWPRSPVYDRYAYLVLVRQRALIRTGKATPERIEPWLPDPAQAGVSVTFKIARAEWAAQQGDAAGASYFFEQAMQDTEASGTPARVALVVQSYGLWLLQHGEPERATELAARVAVWARDDYGCALFRLRLFHAIGRVDLWTAALERVQTLAGERAIPPELLQAPVPAPH